MIKKIINKSIRCKGSAVSVVSSYGTENLPDTNIFGGNLIFDVMF